MTAPKGTSSPKLKLNPSAGRRSGPDVQHVLLPSRTSKLISRVSTGTPASRSPIEKLPFCELRASVSRSMPELPTSPSEVTAALPAIAVSGGTVPSLKLKKALPAVPVFEPARDTRMMAPHVAPWVFVFMCCGCEDVRVLRREAALTCEGGSARVDDPTPLDSSLWGVQYRVKRTG